MALQFDGKTYTTIQDIREHFRVSEKTIRKWIKDGRLPEPEIIRVGTRKFRHFTPDWIQALQTQLNAQQPST